MDVTVNVEIAPLLKLSREERMEIIDQLWESLESEHVDGPLSEAQLAEVLRRKALYEANPESGYTLEQVIDYALRDD
jgi:putative addiction module component (TIGR02574 family)